MMTVEMAYRLRFWRGLGFYSPNETYENPRLEYIAKSIDKCLSDLREYDKELDEMFKKDLVKT